MATSERWHLVDEDVPLYPPEVLRDATPDEFLEHDESRHAIIRFNKVLVGCKSFATLEERDEWVRRHPMGKRVELVDEETRLRKAGNIVEVRVGDPPDERFAAMVIYIERVLPPETVNDWVI